MSMQFCIDSEQLRAAIKEIEAAEKNGFHFCLAVFRMSSAGPMLHHCQAEYSDLIERAHPTDGRYDWGRFQSVTKRNKFKDGKLVPIKSTGLRRSGE